MITATQLKVIMPACDATAWAPPLSASMDKFGINTPTRIADFLGQIAVESAELTHVVENLNYTDADRLAKIFRGVFDRDHDGVIEPAEIEFAKAYVRQPAKLANLVYANRNGNGDEASGDGFNYRGRSPIQLTGKGNYIRAGTYLGITLMQNPDMALRKDVGADIAAWFFAVYKSLNQMADKNDVRGITRAINGAYTALAERAAYTTRAERVLLLAA